MRKTEIDAFIKKHTFEFESMVRKRDKQKVSEKQSRPSFNRTAACNIQRRRDFDQDAVIQQQWLNLVDYIVEVIIMLIS